MDAAAAAQEAMVDDDGSPINNPPSTASSKVQTPVFPPQPTDVSQYNSYLQQKALESSNLVKMIESKLASPEKDSVRQFAHYVRSVLMDLCESDCKKARKQMTESWTSSRISPGMKKTCPLGRNPDSSHSRLLLMMTKCKSIMTDLCKLPHLFIFPIFDCF